jgi:hypothetical protein
LQLPSSRWLMSIDRKRWADPSDLKPVNSRLGHSSTDRIRDLPRV